MDKEALRKKYLEERDKRLRKDGNDQYITLEGKLSYYKKDPYTEYKERSPVNDHVKFAYVGGGFAGLCTGAGVVEAGIPSQDIRIIDKGGDFGGTWYWNRYPGAMCDTASIVYMPYLEETGHIPTEKYAHGPEILEQSKNIATKYNLYDNALLHTEVTDLSWEETNNCWRIKTNRGDNFTATFLGVGTGPFVTPKLPGIPGIQTFKGHSFHTSRWDYEYTGGSPDLGGELTRKGGGSKIGAPLNKLGNKVVALIGTGATAVQCVPHLAAACKKLYIFQRTPSSVDKRGNIETDKNYYFQKIKEEPGWQTKFQENFAGINTGRAKPGEEDLVKDGWTDLMTRILKSIKNTPRDKLSRDAVMKAFEDADNEKMNEIRARTNEIVHNRETADKLKAWYRQLCKRPTFHDEYLESFNRPSVTLVDCSVTKGVERINDDGLIVDGKEYKVDCIIYGSGFEVGGDMAKKNGFEITGQNGLTLTSYWKNGMRSKHGIHIHSFPNLFYQGLGQNAAYAVNVPHNYVEQGKTVGAILAHAKRHGYDRVEVTKGVEDAWVEKILSGVPRQGMESCTPGYYNNEGRTEDMEIRRYYGAYPDGPLAYFKYLQKWRRDGIFDGIEFSSRNRASILQSRM